MITSFFEWGNAIALLIVTAVAAFNTYADWRNDPSDGFGNYFNVFIVLIVGLNMMGAVVRALF